MKELGDTRLGAFLLFQELPPQLPKNLTRCLKSDCLYFFVEGCPWPEQMLNHQSLTDIRKREGKRERRKGKRGQKRGRKIFMKMFSPSIFPQFKTSC